MNRLPLYVQARIRYLRKRLQMHRQPSLTKGFFSRHARRIKHMVSWKQND